MKIKICVFTAIATIAAAYAPLVTMAVRGVIQALKERARFAREVLVRERLREEMYEDWDNTRRRAPAKESEFKP